MEDRPDIPSDHNKTNELKSNYIFFVFDSVKKNCNCSLSIVFTLLSVLRVCLPLLSVYCGSQVILISENFLVLNKNFWVFILGDTTRARTHNLPHTKSLVWPDQIIIWGLQTMVDRHEIPSDHNKTKHVIAEKLLTWP
jgi:hypothetical protein